MISSSLKPLNNNKPYKTSFSFWSSRVWLSKIFLDSLSTLIFFIPNCWNILFAILGSNVLFGTALLNVSSTSCAFSANSFSAFRFCFFLLSSLSLFLALIAKSFFLSTWFNISDAASKNIL